MSLLDFLKNEKESKEEYILGGSKMFSDSCSPGALTGSDSPMIVQGSDEEAQGMRATWIVEEYAG